MSNDETSSHKSDLEGTSVEPTSPEHLLEALEWAFDYRGDITLHLDGGRSLEGYIFDRNFKGSEPCVRVMPKDGSPREKIICTQIKRIEFSGRDTAAGKSWETWLKKWQEKKARGESANLHPESLDD